jgi:hypothetical protein
MGETHVLGSSPEMLVRVTGRKLEYRPIAGTHPRGRDEADDQRLEQQMLHDEKERAEHVMLVDLGRNDLGRVCRFGSVTVPEFMKVELEKLPPDPDRGYYQIKIRVPSESKAGPWGGVVVLELKGPPSQRMRIPVRGKGGS